MRSVGISESRSYGGCGALPAVYHLQQRGKVPEGLGHHNGSTTSTKTEQWCHPPEKRTADRWRKSRPRRTRLGFGGFLRDVFVFCRKTLHPTGETRQDGAVKSYRKPTPNNQQRARACERLLEVQGPVPRLVAVAESIQVQGLAKWQYAPRINSCLTITKGFARTLVVQRRQFEFVRRDSNIDTW